MLDWLRWAFSSPWNTPHGLITFLAVPVVLSVILALRLKKRDGDDLGCMAALGALAIYFATYIVAFGVRSTLSIGVMFAVIPYIIVCAVTVMAVRKLRSTIERFRKDHEKPETGS